MTPEAMGVQLRLSHLKQREERLLDFRDPGDRVHLLPTGRVVFIIHGWLERTTSHRWIVTMRDTFVSYGESVIVVDWRKGNAGQYWQSLSNTRVVGAMLGRAILNWDIAHRTLMVGFSLGGQIIGEAGLFTQVNSGTRRTLINECHALDPGTHAPLVS